uniref:hypothetical protein n=1 Tax=Paractinoplanes polyasparticus TaxID=2856853 RepID=UPI001C85B7D0|nr:hypothetical protein [Actinoplanes polyasparticus]
MIDTDKLPATQYLCLEVLASRRRLGERLWTFPTSVLQALRELEKAGLVSLMSGIEPKTVRAWLTEDGERAAIDASYSPPHLTLAQGIDTLPVGNDDLMAWARDHGLGLSAGVGAVISHIRHDLRKLPGGKS